ncbi:MAG: SURF1 family protein [Rubrivivax sp.]|nr:SURF1 family protein [Rubrivivax sp.]
MLLNGWLLAAALLVAGGTARLAVWQLDRAAQKSQLQQLLDERRALPPLLADTVPRRAAEVPAVQHRLARLRGRWLDEHTVYLDNRPMAGRTGFYLVTPLLLADGSAVLVQRGFTPRDLMDRTRVPPPPAGLSNPDGADVLGRIAPVLPRLYELGTAASGPIRQNLATDAFAQETRLALRPWVLIELDRPGAVADGLQRAWPAANTGVDKHRGYAAQWFSLSALTIGLYVWFQFIRPRRRAARRSAA